MWNREKYNRILTSIAKEKSFRGHQIKNKEALYHLLSTMLYVSYDTVKGWTRANSKGPGTIEVLENLQNILGAKLVDVDVEKMEEKEMKNACCSDFVKGNIQKSYELIMDYLHSEDCEDENTYCQMRTELRKLRVGIPTLIFSKIEECVDTYIDPMIYDHDNFFAELYTEELGYFDDEKVFHLRDEKSTMKHIGLFYEKMFGIEEEVERFAMRELYPLLVG